MELTYTKNTSFLNEWLSQIKSKAHFIPDHVLIEAIRYIDNGIPGIKDENYKYVPIESILKREFKKIHYQDEPSITHHPAFILPENKITFINGQCLTEQLEKEITIYTQDNIPQEYVAYIGKTNTHQQDFFAALNTAYNQHLIVIHIQQSLKHPLQLYHHITNISNLQQNRIVVLIDDEVKCNIFEYYHTPTLSRACLYNCLTEVYTGKNTRVHWINLQKDASHNLYSINNTAFHLSHACDVKHHQLSLDGKLWRNNTYFHIHSTEINCELAGLSIGKDENIISQNTAVYHHAGYSHSNQKYKNIATDKSTVVFNGFILVNKDAQKTDAYQNSKNLLMSDYATIFAKPQLEIYADDVKCSHGSSTGSLDDNALFYLNSRGISTSEAKKLLLQAFYHDILESIHHPAIQTFIQDNISI